MYMYTIFFYVHTLGMGIGIDSGVVCIRKLSYIHAFMYEIMRPLIYPSEFTERVQGKKGRTERMR